MIINTHLSQNAQNQSMEKFTDRSRKIMALAKLESERLNDTEITPEHILIGIWREGSGIGASAIKALADENDVDFPKCIETLRSTIEKAPVTVDGRYEPVVSVCFGQKKSQLTQECLQNAVKASNELGHKYIGTEHLLLGLMNTECLAKKFLEDIGIRAEEVKDYVLHLLGIPTKSQEAKMDKIHPLLAKLLMKFCSGFSEESLTLEYKDSEKCILEKMDEEFKKLLYQPPVLAK